MQSYLHRDMDSLMVEFELERIKRLYESVQNDEDIHDCLIIKKWYHSTDINLFGLGGRTQFSINGEQRGLSMAPGHYNAIKSIFEQLVEGDGGDLLTTTHQFPDYPRIFIRGMERKSQNVCCSTYGIDAFANLSLGYKDAAVYEHWDLKHSSGRILESGHLYFRAKGRPEKLETLYERVAEIVRHIDYIHYPKDSGFGHNPYPMHLIVNGKLRPFGDIREEEDEK